MKNTTRKNKTWINNRNPNINPHNCSSSFVYQWLTDFSTLKNTAQKIQQAYIKFIQYADTIRTPRTNTTESSYNTFIQHADIECKSKKSVIKKELKRESQRKTSCSKTLVRNPIGNASKDHVLLLLLQDLPNSRTC